MSRVTRRITWIKAARRDFEAVPHGARDILLDALTIVADGGMPRIAKPLRTLGPGVLELALAHRGEAYRVVYALQIGSDVWVVHVFQKKSTIGIKTPKAEIDLVRARIRRLKEIAT